jgi:hypothetical protein
MFWQQSSKAQAQIRGIFRTFGVAQTQIRRILHRDGFCPYHLQRVHYLLSGDHVNHVQFFDWLKSQLHILRDILFTDKAHLPGIILPTQ